MDASPIIRALQNAAHQAHQRRTALQGNLTTQPSATLVAADQPQQPIVEANTQVTAPSTESSQATTTQRRSLQHVIPDLHRYRIAQWMISDAAMNGEKKLMSRTLKQFPDHFRGAYNAKIMRASRYWKNRHDLIARHQPNARNNDLVLTSVSRTGIKKHLVKARAGRGRKRAKWVTVLYELLCAEFDRLRKTGLRFDSRLLRQLALDTIAYSDDPSCNGTTIDPQTGISIKELIRPMWITRFMQSCNIVCRTQTGKLMVSPAKRELIDRQVAFHLGQLSRDLRSGSLREEDIYNSDETHFVVHLHSNRTLARRGENEVKYADVVSGDDGMTMMVTLGGGRDGTMPVPLMIFKNLSRSYPIRGLNDDVPGVAYRSSPKSFMDRVLFCDWLNERRIFQPFPNGRTRVLYVDNCSAHKLTEDVQAALQRSRTVLRFFPACATDLVQPADSFVIQQIKSEWRARWDAKLMDMISNNMWTSAGGSGRLVNPGKRFFLRLAADVVRCVAQKRDSEGILLIRKAMIRCGMALNLNGIWEERQLSPELQNIINKYRDNFNGTPVGCEGDQGGEIGNVGNDVE